jgi:hypothetical protein
MRLLHPSGQQPTNVDCPSEEKAVAFTHDTLGAAAHASATHGIASSLCTAASGGALVLSSFSVCYCAIRVVFSPSQRREGGFLQFLRYHRCRSRRRDAGKSWPLLSFRVVSWLRFRCSVSVSSLCLLSCPVLWHGVGLAIQDADAKDRLTWRSASRDTGSTPVTLSLAPAGSIGDARHWSLAGPMRRG